jgi:hypothetical protein
MQWLLDALYQWITLFLFAIALGFTLYFLAEKDQAKMLWCGLVAWVLIGAAAALFLNTKVLVESPTEGVLIPANDPTPPSPQPSYQIPGNALLLFLGDSLAYGTGTSMTVIRIGDKEMLKIRRTDRGLLVTAQVFSADGRIVAEIRDNQFEINRNNFFRRARPDKHTLIVYDQQNTEVLNIRFLNRSAIQILGIFGTSARNSITVKADQFILPGHNVFRRAFLGSGGDSSTIIQVGGRNQNP